MSKILAICGKKQSGKTTLCNFLHGYQLKSFGIIDGFDLNEMGRLIVQTKNEKNETVYGRINISETNLEFAEWASQYMWPYVKQYSFATALKEMAMGLFHVPEECLYGTNEQKMQVIEHLRWENMPGVVCVQTHENKGAIEAGELILHAEGAMTAREFMQFLGTEVMRKIYDNIWADNTLGDITTEGSMLALIDDGRYDNEIEAVQAAGGKAIHLIRVDSDDTHSSEHGLVNAKFDAVLDARDMSIREMCEALMVILNGWGWLKDPVTE